MTELIFIIIGIVLGSGIMYLVLSYLYRNHKKSTTEKQSVILLERIKKVCNLITVEGDFAEIYHHENDKDYLFGMFSSKKKALILINAKVHIGYDLQKVKLDANISKKQIVLTHFPQPEVLSIEPNLRYYDLKEGMFNKFEASDLTDLNKDAKQHIMSKIPESGLMNTAKKEALQAIMVLENVVETIGWKLDYNALKLTEKEMLLLDK
jgi:hypothetical protein